MSLASQPLGCLGSNAISTQDDPGRINNRARWDGRAVARTLLVQVLGAFLSTGEVVIGIDDITKRRWGIRIKARGPTAIRCALRAAASSGRASRLPCCFC